MAQTRTSGPNVLRDAYRKVIDNIAAAAQRSGRQPGDVKIVAVTKTASPDQIRTLVEMGHADFGENRVQQLQQRVAVLDEFLMRRRTLGTPGTTGNPSEPGRPGPGNPTPKVRWHMIGHLQRNKVKQVIPLVQLIHSVDSLRLAEELHTFAARTERTVEVLLQVNSSGEAAKSGIDVSTGVAAPAVIHLAEQIDTMIHLKLRGLMTIAPYSDNPEDARPCFARTAELFQEVRSAKHGGGEFNILSMGMTGDYQVAIEEGANVVRIGRAIFGEMEQPEAVGT